VAPGATPTGAAGGSQSPVGTVGVTFLGLSGIVSIPFAQDFLALAPLGPGPTITAPNGGTNAPLYFDMAAHRLLFIVGGPEDQDPEDIALRGDDDEAMPWEDQPIQLVRVNVARPERPARVALPETPAPPVQRGEPAEAAWPRLAETYFTAEFAVEGNENAEPVPAMAAAENTTPAGAYPADQANPVTPAELLAAVAVFGLLNGTRWQKELDREIWPRRRPRVFAPRDE